MPNLNQIDRAVPEEIVPQPARRAPVARTIPDTCEHYGWTRTFVYNALSAGKLKARKAGRRTLIDSESSDELHQSLPAAEFRPLRRGAFEPHQRPHPPPPGGP